MPSVFDSTFYHSLQNSAILHLRLGYRRNISRDITLNQSTGEVFANLIVALCITCEKKIKVPVQLCVLSTGFCEQRVSPREICSTFPPLFPPQVNIPCIRRSEESDSCDLCDDICDELCIETQENQIE